MDSLNPSKPTVATDISTKPAEPASCAAQVAPKSPEVAPLSETPRSQTRQRPERRESDEESDSSSSHSDSEAKSAKRQQLQSVSSPSTSTASAAPKLPAVAMSDDVINMIMRFAEGICTANDSEGSDPEMKFLQAWQCCAYTIHSLEVLLRDEGKPLLGHLSLGQHDCLKGLVRMMALLTTAWNQPAVASSHAYMIFTLLVNHDPDQSCVLDLDSFGVMVPLVFLLAKYPVPSGGGYEIYSLRLALFMEIMKCIVGVCHETLKNGSTMEHSDEPVESMDIDDTEAACGESSLSGDELAFTRDFLELLAEQLSIPVSSLPHPRIVWEKVKEYCQPFLRCCVLFFHFLTNVPARDALLYHGGDTFENMCSYLGLSGSWRSLLFDDVMQALAKHWTNHPRLQTLMTQDHSTVFTSPSYINRLVPLPSDYSELLCSVLEFYCHDKVESRCPTMCLVCGQMLCSQTSCCMHKILGTQVGSCTFHALNCGAGCGLFLQVRRCQVLVLAIPNRGTFMTPPYVDDYGETDQGLRRGNRLQLSPELYKELEHMWLSHGIREYISRSMEKGAPPFAGPWHEL